MRTPTLSLRRQQRFGVFLTTLVSFLVLMPFADRVGLEAERFRLLFAVVLLGGLYMLGRSHWELVIAALLAAPAFVGGWLYETGGNAALTTIGLMSGVLFVGFAAAIVLTEVLRERAVTMDTVLGGVTVYFLIGLGWALLYAVIVHVDATAIGFVDGFGTEPRERFAALLYFSFVTLTTLGYGDVVPMTEGTRMLAAGEAVLGQLYVTVFIARLVGLHISGIGREA